MNTEETPMTPGAIVEQLDRHIVGQDDAKRAVAIALRNRWRWQNLSEESLKVAADVDIYTNDNIITEELSSKT